MLGILLRLTRALETTIRLKRYVPAKADRRSWSHQELPNR
jgi:hypothetical protein